MNMQQFLLLQIIAHLLTDYTFQTDQRAKEKNKHGFRSRFLKWHALLAFFFSWMLSFQLEFVAGAFIIAAGHYLIDGFKIYLNRNKYIGKYAYFIDQVLHILLIVLVVQLFSYFVRIQPEFGFFIPIKYVAVTGAFLFCTKPSNILIKEILHVFDIHVKKDGKSDTDLPNAGKLIGVLERWLVLTFILLNQFEAVGFLIAAKSILRFKDNETLKTEYVLIGTMLSFGIALAMTVLVQVY